MIVRTKFTSANNVPSYILEEEHIPIAAFDNFTTAAIVCRFVKAGRLEKPEYDAAVAAMKEFDAEQRERVMNSAHAKQAKGLASFIDQQKQNGSSAEGRDNHANTNAIFV